MRKQPTAAQRRHIVAADPVTGLLRGPEALLDDLVVQRLAFRHPRPPRHHFLTPAGHRLREQLLLLREVPQASRPEAAAERDPSAGVFAARTGTEAEPAPAGPARVREVHSAWQGLLEMRRLTNAQGEASRPCAWERTHLVPAAALALEAAGCRPDDGSGGGYRVTETAQPEAVSVTWPGAGADAGLPACAAALERAGWQAGTHTDRRSGTAYLLASPRRR
ncbi:hypothetical protein [Streptomyces sp. GC420]|uniref:hypothetical protein n=1 Tax=Streptomyces sp. GC420 TaxID=2697568 RepID=UPI00141502FF|nr:hypothetical protein [Streptomyces sp. GC420]NBM18612.1 hypothetical protein [Streptomyces sp. GC420]